MRKYCNNIKSIIIVTISSVAMVLVIEKWHKISKRQKVFAVCQLKTLALSYKRHVVWRIRNNTYFEFSDDF